jgi:hypothetical protein
LLRTPVPPHNAGLRIHARTEHPMAKIEYKTMVMNFGHGDSTAELDKKLNTLGAEGWRSCCLCSSATPE